MNDETRVNETVMEQEEVVTRPEVNDRLLKIAVIGTGNCGSMLANDACESLGLDGIAINGSERDLKLVSCPRVITFKTGDGKGTGKDRDTAKNFFFEDSGLVVDKKFVNTIESNDVIIVATSTGGGYGSGSSTELLELLIKMYPSKVFIAAGVLPFQSEQYSAFEGTKSWLKELSNLNVGYLLYDNNQYSGVTPNKAAKLVNENFVRDIKVFQGDFIGRTFTGGIDERDMLTVLSVPGRIIADSIEGLEPSNVKNGSIIQTLSEHIQTKSAHAEMVTDKVIDASAMMYTLGEEFDEFKGSIKDDLQTQFGAHIKDATNFSDEEDVNSVAVVLTGLSAPNMVIDRVINKAKILGDDINKRKASQSKLFKDDDESAVKTIVAKRSFADETPMVKADETVSKEELLKNFLNSKHRK